MLKNIKEDEIGKEFTLESANGIKGKVKLIKIEDKDVMLENIIGFEKLERINHLPRSLIAHGTEKCFYLKKDWFESNKFKLYI